MRTDQTMFRRAVMDPSAPVPASLTDGAGRPAGRRFAVYRNNVAVSLTEALISGFPACYSVLGDEMFRGMAGAFLRDCPPVSPVMARFGAALPDFLGTAPQLVKMRWIADLARLEYALRDSYHAADCVGLSAGDLAGVPPEALGTMTFALAPSARLVRSDWPVFSIRRRALDPSAPQAQPGREDVLILRAEYDPMPHLLSPGDADFVAALGAGQTLEAAAEAGQTETPDHDPTPILTLLMQSNALTRPSEATP